jgi:hypothetical protein
MSVARIPRPTYLQQIRELTQRPRQTSVKVRPSVAHGSKRKKSPVRHKADVFEEIASQKQLLDQKFRAFMAEKHPGIPPPIPARDPRKKTLRFGADERRPPLIDPEKTAIVAHPEEENEKSRQPVRRTVTIEEPSQVEKPRSPVRPTVNFLGLSKETTPKVIRNDRSGPLDPGKTLKLENGRQLLEMSDPWVHSSPSRGEEDAGLERRGRAPPPVQEATEFEAGDPEAPEPALVESKKEERTVEQRAEKPVEKRATRVDLSDDSDGIESPGGRGVASPPGLSVEEIVKRYQSVASDDGASTGEH